MARNTQVDVRRALALAAAFDFLRCCSTSCLLPFLTLYFRQLGLTPAMTGVVMGTRHLITLAWSPAASFISKRYDRRRATVCGSLLVSAAVALVLLLVPPADVDGRHAVCNMSAATAAAAPTPSRVDILVTGETSTPSTPELAATAPPQINGSVSPNVTGAPPAPARSKRSKVRRRAEAEEERSFDFLGSLKVMDSQHQLFFLLLIAVAIWELAAAPLEWTADDGVHEYLDYADASDRYAGSGPWPLLGAACGAGAAGTLVSQLSCFLPGGTPRSAAHFYLYAGVAALTLPAAAYLPLYLDRKRDRTGGLLKAAQLVRGSPAALLCGATALLVGAASSAVDNFLLWQMQDHGSGELHMGLTLALALLSHAAFPLLAARVSRVLSPGRLLAVGAASLGLQCLYYSFLWAPWAALPAQLLSCFSGGALWWAVRVQSEDVATPGAERSVRRIYGGLCLHLGLGLGGLGGGVVAQRFGVEWLLRAAALALMAWSGALPLLQWKAPLQRRINYSRLLAADASDASDSGSEQERDWLDKALQDDRSSNNNGNNNNSNNNGNSNSNNNSNSNRSSRGGAGRRLNL